MIGRLALSTVRAHPSAYSAAAGVIGVGTALLTSFAALAETGLAAPAHRGESMTMLAAIMGGWSVAIVVFGIASTITLVVRQRGAELALLRAIGATPRQVRRMVLLETVTVATPAMAVGVLPGIGLGAFLLTRMVDAGVVQAPVEFITTWRTVISGTAVTLVAAVAAAVIAGGRAAKIAPTLAMAESSSGTAQSVVSAPKLWFGLLFLLLGLGSGVGTLFMADGPLLAAVAGPACVAVAIGLALLCPIVVGGLGRIAALTPNAVIRLAIRNLAARAAASSTVVGPLAMLVGIATGTLYMQYTENGTPKTAGDDIGAQFAVANYLVVAMIIAFCGIAVTNSLIAATWERRREFAALRLNASTRDQVLGMIVTESALAAGLAILLGTVAAATTVIPYALVKTGSPVPHGSAVSYLVIIGGAAVIACVTTFSTTMRATRTRPALVLATA
ncbi:FtsX-like permease family protein [Nocardia sp. NPDC058058]|uniref:FtsX-like permease family protein n=1 Tax=Nocardia sp. NPDC058058 TaxID=3346317 RepID=UPI0036DF4562